MKAKDEAIQTGIHIPASTAFFEKTFNDTKTLLLEARNYVSNCAADERRPLRPVDAMRMARDISRLTTRLAEIMAWLLTQKAVHAGELTPTEAARVDRRLGNGTVCMEEGLDYDGDMPPKLESLLDRSHKLYVRAVRLDEMIARHSVH